jgi:YD repeat-containing protein
MTVAGQPAVSYTYDNANRLAQVAEGTSTAALGYDAANRRTTLALPNGVVVSYAYDAASQLTGLTYTLGVTALGNLAYGYDNASWHTLGTVTGIGLTTAIGGAARAEAAEANAGKEGYEFSHWIPDRMGGPSSIFNGNYVSEEMHYLTDPFRYPSGWPAYGPKLNPALQQLLRIPYVYDGAAAGAAVGGASALAGRNCGCN